jgi:hypothetical protein
LFPSTAAVREREVADENRKFQSRWTEEYFFLCIKEGDISV